LSGQEADFKKYPCLSASQALIGAYGGYAWSVVGGFMVDIEYRGFIMKGSGKKK